MSLMLIAVFQIPFTQGALSLPEMRSPWFLAGTALAVQCGDPRAGVEGCSLGCRCFQTTFAARPRDTGVRKRV